MSDKGRTEKETSRPGEYWFDKRMWKYLGSLIYEGTGARMLMGITLIINELLEVHRCS